MYKQITHSLNPYASRLYRDLELLLLIEDNLPSYCKGSLIAISGKPGGGKTLEAVRLAIEFLVETDNIIVGNLPFKIPELSEYLQKYYPNKNIDLHKRVVHLDEEEMKEFFRYRDADKVPLKVIEITKTRWKIEFPAEVHPVTYFLDEVHLFFNARGWAEQGLAFMAYNSQHRKLGDDLFWITQSIENVDKQFRSVTQEYRYMRNLGKEMINKWIQAPNIFRREHYLEPAKGQKCIEHHDYPIDLKIAGTYNTAAGIGVPGGGLADVGKDRRKGLNSRLVLTVGLAGIFLFFGTFLYFMYFGGDMVMGGLKSTLDVGSSHNKSGITDTKAKAPTVAQPSVFPSSQVRSALPPPLPAQLQSKPAPVAEVPTVSKSTVATTAQGAPITKEKEEQMSMIFSPQRLDITDFATKITTAGIVSKVLIIDDSRVYIEFPKKYEELITALDCPTRMVQVSLQIHAIQTSKDHSFNLASLNLGGSTSWLAQLVNGATSTNLNLGKAVINWGMNNGNIVQTDTYNVRMFRGVTSTISRGVEIPIVNTTISQGVSQEQTTYKPVLNSIKIIPRFSGTKLILDFDMSLQNILDPTAKSISTTAYKNTQILDLPNSSCILMDLTQKLNNKSSGFFSWSKGDSSVEYLVTLNVEEVSSGGTGTQPGSGGFIPTAAVPTAAAGLEKPVVPPVEKVPVKAAETVPIDEIQYED